MILRSKIKKNIENSDSPFNLSTIQNKQDNISENDITKTNNEDSIKPNIWNINAILLLIFAYTDFKDLVKFNTVCKRWNLLTNPVIHKSIKLQRSKDFQNNIYDKKFSIAAKTDAEVAECISNNSKYAPFVREFKYYEKIEPQRAIEFFQTFRFITNLTLERVLISQYQFLGMISPLIQLEELNLKYVNVKTIFNNRLYTEVVQLPQTLKKLYLLNIDLINNPELFVQTINSHNNLVEFRHSAYNDNDFLQPFSKNYPSLKIFDYTHQELEDPCSLLKIFEFNPQLTTLKLELKCWNYALTSSISRHLINLQEFSLTDIIIYHEDLPTIFLKFIQPTIIKKLNLKWDILSPCSLKSILVNCPELEELSLCFYRSYQTPNNFLALNLNKQTKIKKLSIICDNLSEFSLNSILNSSPQLKELDIQLSRAWREWIKAIGARCNNLEKLTICPSGQMSDQELDLFFQELNVIEFSGSNSLYKATLTHLTLYNFYFYCFKAEYFDSFQKLKSIKFPSQIKIRGSQSKEGYHFDKELWPNYELYVTENNNVIDIELIKV